jgi:hypothetical protein
VRAVSFPGRILLFAKAKERLSRFLNIRSENYPGESQAASRFDDALNGDVGLHGTAWKLLAGVWGSLEGPELVGRVQDEW